MLPHRETLGRAAALLLFSLSATAAFWRGGVSLPAQAFACALVGVALAVSTLPDRSLRTPRLPLLALAPLIVFVVAALQCLPIPSPLLRLIAPVNAELRFALPAPARAFAPITLDLPATAAQLASALAIGCALIASVLLARRPRAQLLLLCTPIAAALLQLAICFVRLAGQGALAGTFVNRNHLAALLVLGALAAMGAALSPPREDEPGHLPRLATSRPLWIASASGCAACALLTLSRGAAAALLAGAIALLFLEQRAAEPSSRGDSEQRGGSARSSPRRSLRRRMLWLFLPLAFGTAAALLISTTPLTARFSQLSEHPLHTDVKLRSFIGAVKVVLDHPLFGVGRGAWQFVAERHRSVTGEMAFVYVENEPLQLAAEEGLPAALIVIALCVLGWLRAARAASSGLSRGVLAGALAVGLQNLVDFNLELIGVSLPLAVSVGASLIDERANLERSAAGTSTFGWKRIPRLPLLALSALALLIAPLPLLLEPLSAEREGAQLAFEARDPSTSSEKLISDAQAAVVRHPADWLISLAPAVGLNLRSPRRTAEALAWAGRAQMLGPLSWRPHVAAGAILLRAGRAAQARVEARLALQNLGDLKLLEPLQLAAQSSKSLDDLLEASPDDPIQRAQLAEILREMKRPELARALAEHELSLPDDARPQAATAALRLELAMVLTDAHEFAAAEKVAARLPLESCGRGTLLAAARKAQNEPITAVEEPLLIETKTCPGEPQLYDLLFHGRLAQKDLTGAEAILDDQALANSTSTLAAQTHAWRAELLEAKGDLSGGLRQRWLAALVAPDEPGRALDYADRLRAGNDLTGALLALRTLSMRATSEARPAIEAKISELEKTRNEERQRAMEPKGP